MAQPLKDMVDRDVVTDIARRFSNVIKRFDAREFVEAIATELPSLELKPRIECIARQLRNHLDDDYPAALAQVVEVARGEPPISGFAAWPLCTFVELFGLDHPTASLDAMEHLTKRASCEFAIRPYLRDHFEEAYATLERFTAHDDEDVRRLPSEGTRPLLPWGMRVKRLTEDPRPGIDLLQRLRHDSSETVRRSVANHLNDVAKSDPELVISVARRWMAEDPPVDSKMVAHALRTLVKRGHPEAMSVLGFTTDPEIEVGRFTVAPTVVRMGDSIELSAEIRSQADTAQRLVVDFIIHHVTARGSRSPKVFKWSVVELPPGESVSMTKKRRIEHASTRTYHAGEHRVDLQLGGITAATTSFVVSLD